MRPCKQYRASKTGERPKRGSHEVEHVRIVFVHVLVLSQHTKLAICCVFFTTLAPPHIVSCTGASCSRRQICSPFAAGTVGELSYSVSIDAYKLGMNTSRYASQYIMGHLKSTSSLIIIIYFTRKT